ncbi:MAG TPA: substrate-binding domain-containing protein [Actinomycetota bacterium]|nr:substrate-binding domain-containing protein [Actinomycetota bacterium]
MVSALVAAACAPEGQPNGGERTTEPTAGGQVQLTDDFSVQHARWATQTVDASRFKKDPPYTIATIVQGPTNGWGTIFDVVMNYELERSGLVEEQLYVPWDFTTESQANGIDDAIAKGVDAILLTALSRAGLAEPVQRAVDAGIPVITCMATVEGDAPTVDVSRSIPMMGYDTAKALAEGLGGQGKVVLLHGIAGVDAAEFWRSGALAALEQYPDIEVVAEDYGQWSVADALDKMRAILAANPEIDGVWVGGLEMGVSVINAFKEAGRPLPFIAGTNPINGFLRLAIENDVRFFAAPFPPSASKLCVETLFKVLKGESVPRFIEVADVMEGTQPFGDDRAEEFYRPEFNDDWIGPAVVPDEVYLDAGFGA